MPLVSGTEQGDGSAWDWRWAGSSLLLDRDKGLHDPHAESWQPKGQGGKPNFLLVDPLSSLYAFVWE